MSYLLNSEAIPLPLQRYLGEPDPRVKNWFLLNTPLGLITIMMLYFTMIKIGTKIMRNRKPINLKNVLIIYNFFQVAFSTYICKEIFMTAYESNYSWLCVHLSPKVNTQTMRMATAFWYFYLSKVIDLADTMFFVLRKKTAQLTILHCYHHGSMVFNWYLGVLYLPGGQAFFSVLVNSFVHAIMYTYYLLSAFGPQMQKHLWWKKYLTQIQLIQFVIVQGHILRGYRNGCKTPYWLTCFSVTYLCTLVILFINFYVHTYRKNKKNNTIKIKTNLLKKRKTENLKHRENKKKSS